MENNMIQESEAIQDHLAIDDLMHRSIKFRCSEGYFKFFLFVASIKHYSRYNTTLVFHQNEAVTYFGSPSYWRKHHSRTIQEDARPYIILAPKGPVMMVYDVFETQGKETPLEFMENNLGRTPYLVSGRLNPFLYDHAVSIVKNFGIKVHYVPFSYFKVGEITSALSYIPEIRLKEGQTSMENMAALLHELAHLFLGHCGYKELINTVTNKPTTLPMRINIPIATKELEAETTCYLILTKLGLKKNSEEYLAGYLKSHDDLKHFSYETVIKTADKIEKLFIDPKLARSWTHDTQQ